jgi:hypothetical protein
MLRLQHTLLLVLLACWRQQEAASPLDITRWALDGHLPYLSFAAEEGAGLTQYRNTLGAELMAPTGGQMVSCSFAQLEQGWLSGFPCFLLHCLRGRRGNCNCPALASPVCRCMETIVSMAA